MTVVSGIIYFSSQIITPSERQKKFFIHLIGFFTICVAMLSILYIMFPSFMDNIAYRYFSGKDSYGLIIDYKRGRILPWGSIIMCFPFFFSSSLLERKRNIYYYLYTLFGFITITLCMVISNFRWIMFCYFSGTILFGKIAYSLGYIKLKFLFYVTFFLVITITAGLIGAKLAFNYNIIDRLLLSNSHRDIEETLGRLFLYKQSIDLFLSKPENGIGAGNYIYQTVPFEFHAYYTKFVDIFQVIFIPLAAHNEFLTVLAETGLFGFISFLSIIYLTFRKIILLLFYSINDLSKTNILLILALFISYISFALYVLFENIFIHNYIYLFIITSIVYTWIVPSKHKNTK